MESASGPHFSGLRIDSLRNSSPSSAKAAGTSVAVQTADDEFMEASKQPFVIGVSGGTASGKTTVCDIIQQLHDHRVVLVNQAPEGIHCVCKRFPSLKIVTSEIDVALNEEFRVIPGLGEFGDRYYFGTDN